MKQRLLLMALIWLSLMTSSYIPSHHEIETLISTLIDGIDQQDGPKIASVFSENASLFATNQGNIMSVPPQQFAELHESKKFGGRERELKVIQLDITDDITASAKVEAFDDTVHYVYYLTFTKTDGRWLIQTFLQHSKMKK